MKQKIYIDTSVIGGLFDKEFQSDTRLFFDRIYNNEFDVFISEISIAELQPAPEKVKDVLKTIPTKALTRLDFDEKSRELANHYIKARALGKASVNDAYHIAISTVNELDVLVSWNFRHIVNLDKIILFNEINLKYGFSRIDIRSPKELIKYED